MTKNEKNQQRIMEEQVRECSQFGKIPTVKDLNKMVVLSGYFDNPANLKAYRKVRRELKKLNVNTEVY